MKKFNTWLVHILWRRREGAKHLPIIPPAILRRGGQRQPRKDNPPFSFAVTIWLATGNLHEV
jgi:hypothetical protein